MKTKLTKGNLLKGRAIAGTSVIILAWDFISPSKSAKKNLLGFALEREEYSDAGELMEKYWLKGMKRFKDKDKFLAAGTLVSTAEHPIQSFQWGDYTVSENRNYKYRIVPVYGKPKMVDVRDMDSLILEISTEPATGYGQTTADTTQHDIYFNRGVIGSQAYAREFGTGKPDDTAPQSKEMKWLSRGLFEALLEFIGKASSERFSLRASFYEFKYQPVANAFAKALEAGADVQIVYDAESTYKTENLATIRRAGLEENVIPRTVSEGIRHNKFIVLLDKGKPIAVWTGSTNISAGGIFGHSNVGHVVWDKQIAKDYFAYWERLAENLTASKIRPLNKAASPLPEGNISKSSVTPLFSPRDEKDENTTLSWYADRMAEAKELICMTVAFNLDETFQQVISKENDVLRYLVKDDDLGTNEIIGVDRDVVFAAGGFLEKNQWANFSGEIENPLNSNDYIHTKFLLIDPLGNDPLVVTGSANFSRPSQRINDENMLVIRGNERVADIYFGEFMRIFDHHYSRYLAKKLRGSQSNNSNIGYLDETGDWIEAHFNPESYKNKRRKYFVGK